MPVYCSAIDTFGAIVYTCGRALESFLTGTRRGGARIQSNAWTQIGTSVSRKRAPPHRVALALTNKHGPVHGFPNSIPFDRSFSPGFSSFTDSIFDLPSHFNALRAIQLTLYAPQVHCDNPASASRASRRVRIGETTAPIFSIHAPISTTTSPIVQLFVCR